MALVPLQYNLRSLFVRKSTTVLTIASTAATVAVLAGVMSLQQGFAALFVENGRTDLAVFLRPGAMSEGESSLRRQQTDVLIKGSPEFKLGADNQPLAAAEIYLAIRLEKTDGGETNVPIRGVQQTTFAIHGDDVRITEGQNFAPGSDEIIVGRSLTNRIRNCRIGNTLLINTTPFKVVGIFESKGGYRSEIWGDVDRMMAALKRGNFSRVIAVLKDESLFPALVQRLDQSEQVPVKAFDERTYLQNQTGALSVTFMVLGTILALIMGLAAVFTGTNAMLSAIASRFNEIGILLSVGFRPPAIFLAFLLESVTISLLGGICGCVLVLPFNGLETGTTNLDTFSEVVFTFRTTPTVLAAAVGFALALGLVGGAIPAWKASRLEVTEALRRT